MIEDNSLHTKIKLQVVNKILNATRGINSGKKLPPGVINLNLERARRRKKKN